MEQFLLKKLNALADVKRDVLDNINYGILLAQNVADSYVIAEASLTNGEREIIVLPHGRSGPTPLHRHDYVEIMILVAGELCHDIGGERIMLSEGDVLFMNRHIAHSISSPRESDVAFNIIMSNSFLATISPELESSVFKRFIAENSKDDGQGIYLHFTTKGQKQLENLVENILYELTEYTADTSVLLGTATLLFRYLSLKHGELLVASTSVGDHNLMRIEAISSYIKSDFCGANLPALAARLDLTVPYLSKLISTTFGKSFKDLVIEERVSRAVELLCKTNMPIGAIIRSVGYENASYFHREFKRRIGKTPLEVRKNR